MLTGTMSACFVSLCTCSSTSAACVWLTDDFFFLPSSGKTWRSPSISYKPRGPAAPTVLEVNQLQPHLFTPVTWREGHGQVWGHGNVIHSHLVIFKKKNCNMISFVIFRRPAFLSHFSTEGLHRHGNTKAQEKEVSVCGCAFQGC